MPRYPKNRKQQNSTGLEILEGRMLLAASPVNVTTGPVVTTNPNAGPPPFGISVVNGSLRIKGNAADNIGSVSMVNGKLRALLQTVHWIEPDINTKLKTVLTDDMKEFDPAAIKSITFFGEAGNDSFNNGTSIGCTAHGGNGNDWLIGGSGIDALRGNNGADHLEGKGGNDDLNGGAGNDDYIFTGLSLGADVITEASYADSDEIDLTGLGIGTGKYQAVSKFNILVPATLDLAKVTQQTVMANHLKLTLSSMVGLEDITGTNASDNLLGNSRPNRIYAMGGGDNVDGRAENDIIFGGAGKDNISGASGNDLLYGDAGNDLIHGNAGNDSVYGGDNNDLLYQDSGGGIVAGDNGNDRLYAGTTATSLYGGMGDDVLMSIGGSQADSQAGGYGFDSFWLDAESTEKLTDADSAEIAAGHVHRVAGFETNRTRDENDVLVDSQTPSRQRLGQTYIDPLPISSSLVKANFSDRPLFPTNGPSVDDVDQGSVGDCYFVAALSAFARTNPDKVRQLVTDLGDGTYAVHFKKAGASKFVRVDGDLWTSGGANPSYAGLGTDDSLWVAIIEKAYAFFKNGKGTYDSIAGGNGAGTGTPEALWAPKTSYPTEDFANKTALLAAMKAQLNAGKAITVGGPAPFLPTTAMNDTDNPNTSADENTWRRGAHVYTLISVSADNKSVVLRNPWASDGGGSDADPNDGYVTISAELMYYCSGGFAAYTV